MSGLKRGNAGTVDPGRASPVALVARLHFHPDVEAALEGATCRLRFGGSEASVSWRGWEHACLEETVYGPEFGIERPNRCLALSSAAAALDAEIEIEAPRPG